MAARLLPSALLLGLLAAAADAFAPAPVYREPASGKRKALLASLQGRWETGAGKLPARAPGGRSVYLRIKGHSWELVRDFRGQEVVTAMTMHLDPKQTPATLDLGREGLDRLLMKGIVKVEGDTLTFCYTRPRPRFDTDRPVSFEERTTASGQRVYRMVWKRVK